MPSSSFPRTYEILVERDIRARFLSSRTVGTDAVDAMWRVPGVDDVELLEEDPDQKQARAKISYLYMGEQRFMTIDAHLQEFGLKRVREDSGATTQRSRTPSESRSHLTEMLVAPADLSDDEMTT